MKICWKCPIVSSKSNTTAFGTHLGIYIKERILYWARMSSKLKKKKAPIPKAVREQVWIKTFGKTFTHKCYISWCENRIDVFSFHVGHDIPESRGGRLNISNLKPICARCNLSMSNNYTIEQWNDFNKQTKCCSCILF